NLGANAAYAMRQTGGVLEVRLEAVEVEPALAAQPVRMVRDLKRAPPAHGTEGLWGGIGPDGHFRNLSMRPRSRSGRTLVIRNKRPTRTRRDDAHDGGCCTTSRIVSYGLIVYRCRGRPAAAVSSYVQESAHPPTTVSKGDKH